MMINNKMIISFHSQSFRLIDASKHSIELYRRTGAREGKVQINFRRVGFYFLRTDWILRGVYHLCCELERWWWGNHSTINEQQLQRRFEMIMFWMMLNECLNLQKKNGYSSKKWTVLKSTSRQQQKSNGRNVVSWWWKIKCLLQIVLSWIVVNITRSHSTNFYASCYFLLFRFIQ